MKWLLRGMAKRKEILAEIGPRPKYVISPELLQDCLNLTKDTFNTLQSIKQKRKEMDTNTQPFQWSETTALLFAGYYMSKTDQGEADKEKIIADFKERLRPHSTVTEERREGWEILKFIDNNENLHAKHHYHPDTFATMISEKTLKIHSVKRLSDGVVFSIGDEVELAKSRYKIKSFKINSQNILEVDAGFAYPLWFGDIQKAAPIPEEPKPVLPIVPVYLTHPQIDKLIEMLGGNK